jgi:Mrp family chromosome partitioning ATPase
MPPALGVPISAIEDIAGSLRDGGAAGRSVAVFGAGNDVDTSLAAITVARSLAKNARVVLVDLGAGNAEIRAISSDPSAPGLAELVSGTASFGNIITKDKLSPLHLISAGQSMTDEAAILGSRSLESTFEALARSYDHVVVDAGTVAGVALDRVAQIAPRALLVADALTSSATMSARERLRMAGYGDVTVLLGARTRETSRAA